MRLLNSIEKEHFKNEMQKCESTKPNNIRWSKV